MKKRCDNCEHWERKAINFGSGTVPQPASYGLCYGVVPAIPSDDADAFPTTGAEERCPNHLTRLVEPTTQPLNRAQQTPRARQPGKDYA